MILCPMSYLTILFQMPNISSVEVKSESTESVTTTSVPSTTAPSVVVKQRVLSQLVSGQSVLANKKNEIDSSKSILCKPSRQKAVSAKPPKTKTAKEPVKRIVDTPLGVGGPLRRIPDNPVPSAVVRKLQDTVKAKSLLDPAITSANVRIQKC